MEAMGEHAALAYGQLAELLKAGMPLPDALRTLSEDAQNWKLQASFDRVADEMERGTPAEEAFHGEEPALGGMLTRIAASTAGTGKLPELLHELSRWTLVQDRIRRQIREAVGYPMLVLFLASGLFLVTGWGMGDAVARFNESWDYTDTTTQLWMEFFHLLFLMIAWTGLLIPVLWACSNRYSGVFQRFSRLQESLALRLPLIRSVARPLALSRFCSSVALLTKADVPFHDAVMAAGKLSDFWPYEKEATAIARQLSSGAAPEAVWEKLWLFPGTVRFMIAVGVQRGDMSRAFEQLARLFEIEAEGRGRLVALLLPPICLLALGVLVAVFLALAVLPLYSLLQVMERLG